MFPETLLPKPIWAAMVVADFIGTLSFLLRKIGIYENKFDSFNTSLFCIVNSIFTQAESKDEDGIVHALVGTIEIEKANLHQSHTYSAKEAEEGRKGKKERVSLQSKEETLEKF